MKLLSQIFLCGLALLIPNTSSATNVTAEAEGLPLKTKRHLQFTTDEGTWLSLDISPDGETIVFDLLGDLYSLNIAGGKATPLLTGLAFESQPTFSPDGTQIAFISDRSGNENVWIANRDGTNLRQLSKDTEDAEFTSPAWSAEGDYVYASRNALKLGISVFETRMYHTKGGSGIPVTKAMPNGTVPLDQRHTALGAAPSSDGKYLYYATKTGAFEYNPTFPLWHITRRDLQTGAIETVITAHGSAMRPTLSPDGTALAYATRLGKGTVLRLRSLKTGADKLLAEMTRDDQEGNASRDLMPAFSFTPDGKAIVINTDGKIKRLDLITGDITTIPFTVDVNLAVGPDLRRTYPENTGDVQARIIQAPHLSPSGDKLAFSALARIYVMDIKSGQIKALTDAAVAASEPTWSPDGKTIVYVSWGKVVGGHIWEIKANGAGKPRQLSEYSAFYSDPVISPDGKTLIALQSSDYERTQTMHELFSPRATGLVHISRKTGAQHTILQTSSVKAPHFSAASDRVYFTQHGSLKSVDLEGKTEKTHLQATGIGSYYDGGSGPVQSIQIAPNGKWALIHHASQLYLVAVPPAGVENSLHLEDPAFAVRKITDVGADYFSWENGGRTIQWAIGHTVYSQPFDQLIPGQSGEPPAPTAHAVNLTVPRDIHEEVLVLRGATVLPMQDSRIVENADIVITGNRITAVGPKGTVTIPEGATLQDVSGKYIIPGFVDTHAHWYEVRRDVTSHQNWSFLINLAYGVTSGLDVQAFDQNMFVYQDMVDAGITLGPRVYSVGRGIFSDTRLNTKQDALNALSRNKNHYQTPNIKSYVIGNRKQRQLMVMASEELGMIPTTEGAIDTKLDITHAIDGFPGNEHALTLTPLYRDVVQLFAQTKIGYTPTLLITYGGPWAETQFFSGKLKSDDAKVNRFMPRYVRDKLSKRTTWAHPDEHIFPDLAQQVAKIYRAGGLIGVGSHAEFQGLGYHWEMEAIASGGLSPHEVLQAATRMGSEIIGRSADVGTLEPGKFADLLILQENPLEAIENAKSIIHVMKNGRLYEGDTLNETWPAQRPLPAAWYANPTPQ